MGSDELRYRTNPVRYVADMLGNKWALLILCELHARKGGSMRMTDLCHRMDDCSRKLITLTLNKLADNRLVVKTLTDERTPRVEYGLTEMGRTLVPYIENLIKWTKLNYQITDNLYTD